MPHSDGLGSCEHVISPPLMLKTPFFCRSRGAETGRERVYIASNRGEANCRRPSTKCKRSCRRCPEDVIFSCPILKDCEGEIDPADQSLMSLILSSLSNFPTGGSKVGSPGYAHAGPRCSVGSRPSLPGLPECCQYLRHFHA